MAVGASNTIDSGLWNDDVDEVNADIALTYQWFLADTANGTNQLAITGATSATYTPLPDQAEQFFLVQVTATDVDGASQSATTGWLGLGNLPPRIEQASPLVFAWQEDVAPQAILLTAADEELVNLFWDIQSVPSLGELTLVGSGPAPQLTYAPYANAHGADTATVRVTDVHGATELLELIITLAAVNDPPENTIPPTFLQTFVQA